MTLSLLDWLPAAVRIFIESFFRHEPLPRPDLWAEQSIYLPRKVSPGYEGPFRCRAVPWTREIICASVDPGVKLLTFVCGTQSAKTTTATAIALYKTIVQRLNAVWMWPKHAAGRSFCLSRFKPVIEASPDLARVRPANDDLYKNDEIHFEGAGVINFVGSHSAVDQKSRPAGLVITDETDDIYQGNEKDADPVTNLAERGKTILDALQVRIGSPTIETRPAWKNFKLGDQRHYFLPCPACNVYQTLEDVGPVFILAHVPPGAIALPPEEFAAAVTVAPAGARDDWHLRWDPEARRGESDWDYARVGASARYHCVACDHAWLQIEKDDIMHAERGRWVPTVAAREPGARSYRLPSLYPCWPGTTFAENAIFFLKSRASQNERQSYEINWRARPFSRGQDTTDRANLAALVEMIAGPHTMGERQGERTLLLVDVQRHYVVWAWFGFDPAGNTYLLDSGTARDPEAVLELDDRLHPDFVLMDARHRAQEVYAVVHTRRARWIALRGDQSGAPLKPVYNFDPFTGERQQGIYQITLLHLHTYHWGEELLARIYPPADAADRLPDFDRWRDPHAARTAPATTAERPVPRIRDFFVPRDLAAKAPHSAVQLYNEYIIEFYDARGNLQRRWTERKNNHLFDLAKYALAAGSFLGFTRQAVKTAQAVKDATAAAAAQPAQEQFDLSTPRGGTRLFGP